MLMRARIQFRLSHHDPVFSKYNINPNIFLHGCCDEFAQTLNERFGYTICIIWNKVKKQLVHAFCTKYIGRKRMYIDVRGITDNWKLFASEFDDEINHKECQMIDFRSADDFLEYLSKQSETWLDSEDYFCSSYLDVISASDMFAKKYSIQSTRKD